MLNILFTFSFQYNTNKKERHQFYVIEINSIFFIQLSKCLVWNVNKKYWRCIIPVKKVILELKSYKQKLWTQKNGDQKLLAAPNFNRLGNNLVVFQIKNLISYIFETASF